MYKNTVDWKHPLQPSVDKQQTPQQVSMKRTRYSSTNCNKNIKWRRRLNVVEHFSAYRNTAKL